MNYKRMPIEIEAPEQLGYHTIDCNLTESSYTDFRFRDLGLDLNELLISYVDHRGHPGLRKLLSEETKGVVHPDQVLLTSGAAQALFIISSALLDRGDELVVVRPNYATNLETPRAIEADLKIIDLDFESGYRTHPESIKAAITSKTKLVSITVPHNPTGTVMSERDLQAIIEITGQAGCMLLVDETYREMNFDGVMPHAATLAPHVISVASFSKTFGLPGIRVGWLMTRNQGAFESFFAAKEQIQICGSALDEEIAYQFYAKKDQFLQAIQANLKRKFSILKNWIEGQNSLEWIEPRGGCVAFPRFKKSVAERIDLETFYKTLNNTFSTYVGPGHWFEQSKFSMRIGYGWPAEEELRRGLENISKAIELSKNQ
jgi:aspartate/methionine/tyrosine aminotransferase